MICPAGNQAYIYYDEKTDNFPSSGRTDSGVVGIYNNEHMKLFYFPAMPDTELTGIRLAVKRTTKVRLYYGHDASDNPPATALVSDEDTTGEADVFLAFDKTTFGGTGGNKLLLGLVRQDGAPAPVVDEIDFYGTMIAFPDGFFDKIIPSRADRGGGVIELADGTLVQYKGYGGNRWRWKLGAKFVDKQMLDRLDTLYAQRPEFYFAQEPDRYPNRIHRCILDSPIFRIPYTTQWKGNGYSVEMDIAQV